MCACVCFFACVKGRGVARAAYLRLRPCVRACVCARARGCRPHRNRTFFAPATSTSGFSLMEIKFTNTDGEVWAVGGQLGELFPAGTL